MLLIATGARLGADSHGTQACPEYIVKVSQYYFYFYNYYPPFIITQTQIIKDAVKQLLL